MRPVLIEVAGYPVTAWAAGLVLATLAAGFGAWRTRPAGFLTLSQFLDLCLFAAIGAGVGARLVALLAAGQTDPTALLAALQLWKPAPISSFGAAMGAMFSVSVYAVRRRLDLAAILGHLLPFGVLGAGIQRLVGCFLTGCCAGIPTTLPWGVQFPGGAAPVHPTQVYLGLAYVGVFAVARRANCGNPTKLAAAVVLAFATASLAIGSIRPHEGETILGILPLSQALHLAIAVVALVVWLGSRSRIRSDVTSGPQSWEEA